MASLMELTTEQQLSNINSDVYLPSEELASRTHGLCASQACLSPDTIDIQGLLQLGALCKLNKAGESAAISASSEEGNKTTGHCRGSLPALCEL